MVRGLPLKHISISERKALEEEFSLDEMWEALSSCDGNKTPGLDSLNLNFVKVNWSVINKDFMNFL